MSNTKFGGYRQQSKLQPQNVVEVRGIDMEQKDISVNVSSHNDGYWEHFMRNDPAPYEVTGKYLFFSTEQNHLVEIAIAALERGSFHQAKVGRAFSRDQVIEKKHQT